MRLFQRAETAVSQAAEGAGEVVKAAVVAAALAVVLLAGVIIGVQMRRM